MPHCNCTLVSAKTKQKRVDMKKVVITVQPIARCRLFRSSISTLLLLFATLSFATAVENNTTYPTVENNGSEREFVIPHVHYDITTAELWRCSTANVDDKVMKTLATRSHLHRLEILEHDESWVDLLTSQNPTDKLQSLGLTECTTLTSIRDLLTTELEQNWGILQHHNLHPSWQNVHGQTSQSTQQSLSGISKNVEDEKQVHIGSHEILKRDANDDSPEENQKKCQDSGKCDKLGSGETVGSGGDHLDNGWFDRYHNYSGIYDWFYQLAEDHPNMVFLNRSIGKTYYGRDILAVHFTDRQRVDQAIQRRPKIYLQCLLHPREWVTGSVCMYLAKNMASPYSQSTLVELLSKVEFVMLPVANPDGYFLTWFQYPKFRLWRKNTQSFSDSICSGVDLNRNFNVSNWNQEAVSFSSDHCSELYRGPYAASEMEVRAISSYFESLSPVIGAIDFHSYHQEVLYPPASRYEVPDQVLKTIDEIAMSVASRASEVGVTYSYKKMIDIYSATGTFADWILMRSLSGEREDECLVPLTIELRPTFDETKGVYSGFLLPATQILPTCQEMLPAVIRYAELTHNHSTTCLSRP